jgi:hypothetical protein
MNFDKEISISFPSNHLMISQLMHDLSNSNNNTDKFEYFCFMSLMPGVNTGDGNNRTYDFKSGITLKYSIQEIKGLSFTLEQWALGNGQNCLPYAKFSRSNSGQKSVTAFETPANSNKQYDTRKLILVFSIIDSKVKHSLSLTPEQAYSTAAILSKIFEKGLELEFNRQSMKPRQVKNYISNQQQEEQSFSMTEPTSTNQNVFSF